MSSVSHNLDAAAETLHARRRSRSYASHRSTYVWGLASLPSHWKEKPLKHLARINPDKLADNTDPDYEIEYVDIGNVTLEAGIGSTEKHRFEGAPSRARRLVRDGDTIVSTVRTYLKAVAPIANPPGNLVVSTGFAVLRPGPDLVRGYLFRLAQSDVFVQRIMAHSVGVSYPAINASDIGKFAIPIPPLEEQRAIAAFLDRETAKIDELIAKKQLVVDRLLERRTAFVNRLVTEGLDADAERRPGCIVWLPAVPAHWQSKPLKYVADLQTGLTLGKKYDDDVQLADRPYLRVANVQDGYLDLTEITTVAVPAATAKRHELRPGDVLLTEGGDFDKLGRGYVWNGQIVGCLHQNHIFAVRPHRDDLDPHFLATVLGSVHGKNYFTSTSNQTTNLASTNSTKLKAFPVPLPPKAEQEAIMTCVRSVTGQISKTVDAIVLAIRKLREYRSTLISAAVTGQIDVREADSAAPTVARRANKHFHRCVLAAEIIDRHLDTRRFGQVKLQKLLILAEGHLRLTEIQSEPLRAAAGPFDNRMMRSIHVQLARQKWYAATKTDHGTIYSALAKSGDHRKYFDRYWADRCQDFDALIALFKDATTEQVEIVATLYSAWNDFLLEGKEFDESRLVDEVLTNWDPAKQRIEPERWFKAIEWMREKWIVPTGFGSHTRGGRPDDE